MTVPLQSLLLMKLL